MRHMSSAHLPIAAALVLLHAAGAHAQSCATLSACAQSAIAAETQVMYLFPENGHIYFIWQDPHTGAGESAWAEWYVGPYFAKRVFHTAEGAPWTLRVYELLDGFEFYPRNRAMKSLDFSQGVTLAVATQVRQDEWDPGAEPEIFGALRSLSPSITEPLLAFGQASPTQWFFRRRLQALGDNHSVMSVVMPWDPTPTEDDWVTIYLTFQKDGKLRIDQLSLIDGAWYASLLEDGWPISNLGEADASGNVSPVTYFDWHDFYVGTPVSRSGSGGGRVGEVWVFEKALTPQEILGHHWSRTGLSNLDITLQPCNTGLYLNGAEVKTPCGKKAPPQ